MFVLSSKKSAFTLIELLVVIVIIGILATISVAQYNDFMAKARDARRQDTVANINKLVQLHYTSAGDVSPYSDLSKTKLEEIFSNHGYTPSEVEAGICYFVVWDAIDEAGDTNSELAVVTWGETTSSATQGTPGLIVTGTPQGVINLTNASVTINQYTLTKEHFEQCSNGTNTYIDHIYSRFILGDQTSLSTTINNGVESGHLYIMLGENGLRQTNY